MPAYISPSGSLVRRLDAITVSYLTGFSVGPVAVGDSSAGLLDRVWYIREDAGSVYIARANNAKTGWDPEQLLFTYTGEPIIEVDLAFDQNGNVVVAAQRGGLNGDEVWQYWYDSRLGAYAFTYVCQGRSPRLLLDDPKEVTDSDVLLVYVGASSVELRQQRDFYETVYAVPNTNWYDTVSQAVVHLDSIASFHVEEVARSRDNRLVVIGSYRDQVGGTYRLYAKESAPYPARPEPEEMTVQSELTVADLVTVIVEKTIDAESVDSIGNLDSMDLVLLVTTVELPPDDNVNVSSDLGSMDLVLVIVTHELPPDDSVDTSSSLSSMDLVVTVLTHSTTADEDNLNVQGDLTSMTLVTV